MSLTKHLYKIDNKGRVSLSAQLKTEAEDAEVQLLVDPNKLGEKVSLAGLLSTKDKEALTAVFETAENFSARTLGVIMPKIAIPIQQESDIVAEVFRQFALQKYDLKIDQARRFVLPHISEYITRPGLLFQDLKTIDFRGKIIDVLALAVVTPNQAPVPE